MSRYVPGDVVFFLPGIMGSVLARDEGRGRYRELWSPAGGAVLRAIATGGDSIRELELPAGVDDDVDFDDGVVPLRLMPDIHLVPGLLRVDGYGRWTETLRVMLNLGPGRDFIPFPYDWRLSNRVSARRLQRCVLAALDAQRTRVPEAKAVLVAHSMGGIVSRYFLEVLGGWEVTRTLVTFGTPYGGSPQALAYLMRGFGAGTGPLALDLSPLVRSFPSIYQLLPTYECVTPADGGEPRMIRDVPELATINQQRVARALAFHDEIADRVRARSEEWTDRIYPIVGIEQETTLGASVKGGTFGLESGAGDGTVPERSATPFEFGASRAAFFAAQRHGSLQNDDAALAQLRGLLRPAAATVARTRDAPKDALTLELPELFAPGEILSAVVRYDPDNGRPALAATLSRDDGTVIETSEMQPFEAGAVRAIFDRQPGEGCYRVVVSGAGTAAVRPVAEVCAVIGGRA